MTLRRRAAGYPACLVVLLTVSGQAQTPPESTLASPEQFFGFQMGADRKLANWDKLHEYYQLLAKGSNKMKLVELGKTSEGRPYIALFISSPANLAKLDQIQAAQRAARRSTRALARPRRGSSSPKAGRSSSSRLRCTRARSPRRRRPPSSSTTASRGPTRKRSGCSTT